MTLPRAPALSTSADDRYERLVELAPDGIIVHDGKQIVAANAAAVRMARATRREELIGQSVTTILDPPFLKAVQNEILGTYVPLEPAPPVRDVMHRLDGSDVDVEVRTVVFLDEGVPSAHLVIRDITERLAAEHAAREMSAHLQQTQKMEAVGALAGGVAHEVNNMLQVVLGFGVLLLEDPIMPASCLADLREIQKAASHAAVVTRQLLEFSRHAIRRPQVVDLASIVRGSVATASRLLGVSRQLIVDVDAAPLIWFDPGQFEQIFINLVLNARDATSRTGTISIAGATETIQRSRIAADGVTIPAGTYGLLSVTDNGEGMSAETQARIFEPFFTTKRERPATGLGLAVVHGLLAQNGGYVSVSSAEGEGTSFSLYLPLFGPPPHTLPDAAEV